MKLRTQALDYETDDERLANGLFCEEPTQAVQSSRDETDINVIVRKMGIGHPPPIRTDAPMQGDFTNAVDDYRTAVTIVQTAENYFMQLPAELRARFENDPQQCLDFLWNPENAKDLVRLGLAVPKPPEAPMEVPAATEAAK